MSEKKIQLRSPQRQRILVVGESYIDPVLSEDFECVWIGKDTDELAKGVEWREKVPIAFPDIFDVDEYRPREQEIVHLCDELQDRIGPFQAVVAHTEQTLEIGAVIRESLAIEGTGVDAARVLRDKLLMRDAAARDPEIPMPIYVGSERLSRDSDREAELNRFSAIIESGVVVKPTCQAGSNGVRFHEDRRALSDDIRQRAGNGDKFIVEEKIAGVVHHVDGLVVDHNPIVLNVARYVHDCMSWLAGGAMSSREIENEALESRLRAQTERVVNALRMNDTTFHMEFIVSEDNKPYFLEVGGRPGGAGVAIAVLASQGVDLWKEAFRLDAGVSRSLRPRKAPGRHAWLVLPTGHCRDAEVTRVVGVEHLPPAIIMRETPEPGDVMKAGGVSGKFWMRAESGRELEDAIQIVVGNYGVESKRLCV